MMRAMGGDETDALGFAVQRPPEEDASSQIDAYLKELLEVRRGRIRAAADKVFDQVLDQMVTELKEQLESEGVDAHQDELRAAAELAYSDRVRQRREDQRPTLREIARHRPTATHIEYTDAIMYIANAATAGIFGNVTYDALKTVLRRLSSRRHSGTVTKKLEEVVLFAVAEQCRRYQMQVDPSQLRVREWQLNRAYAFAKVDAKGSELTAEVTVPYLTWRQAGVGVSIRAVSQPG
jgi:hypothetical protein